MTARERAMRLLYLVWLNLPVFRPLCDRMMERVFSAWAPGWDDHVDTHGVDRFAALAEALDRLDVSPRSVLDLGCGTGTATIALAERYPDAWVTGLDVSTPMIAEATRKASAAGSSARFDIGRLQATGLPSESADLVVLLNAPPAFDEIHRLLRPGGHVVVAASRGSRTAFYSSAKRLERGFRRRAMRTVAHGGVPPGEFYVAAKR
jgi:SAM-dependent methyltransferase